MTNQEVQAYWELASLVKQAADEEGIDLDELAEQMNDEELAEFLDAAMQGALEGAEEEANAEDSVFLQKSAELIEKVAFPTGEKAEAEAAKVGSKAKEGALKRMWKYIASHKGGFIGAPAGAAVGGLGAYLLARRKAKKR
jgi:hypothetical protein